jgi:hypothetical protein
LRSGGATGNPSPQIDTDETQITKERNQAAQSP